MEKICEHCNSNPDYHSFNHIYKYNSNSFMFYTKIIKAKDDEDIDALLNHYKNYLEFVNPDKWSWIINFDGFTIKHLLKINLTVQLGKLIQKYDNLEKIHIINSNKLVANLISTLRPLLGGGLFSKIEFLDKEQKEKIFKEYPINGLLS